MKPFHLNYIFALLISLAFSGCQKTYIVSKSQDILFQIEYLSNAGVYSHWGLYIDVNGNVMTYNLPGKWNFPKENQTLTKQEVNENIAACKLSNSKIRLEELRKYTNFIDNLAASKVTLPKNHLSDIGTLSFYCFQYSESSSEYKRSIIKTEGHINCENLNFYSKKVVSWMSEYQNAISR
jgi:hypothetical protein